MNFLLLKIFVLVFIIHCIKTASYNIALLVLKGKDIDETLLHNSLSWTQKHVLRGHGVSLNIRKVVIDKNLKASQILENENFTSASFSIEPYYTIDQACMFSDLLNIPLITVADDRQRTCQNIIAMRPDRASIIRVTSELLTEERIMDIGVIMEISTNDFAAEFIASSYNGVKTYFMFVKVVDMNNINDIKKAFEKIINEKHKHLLLVLNSFNNRLFIDLFNQHYPNNLVKWYVPVISDIPFNEDSFYLAGLSIPIDVMHAEQVKMQINAMKTANEKLKENYLSIMPLLHDAIVTIAEAIKLSPRRYYKNPWSEICFPTKDRKIENYLSEYIKNISFHGMSGKVYFSSQGYRGPDNLNINERINNGSFEVTGKWMKECEVIRWIQPDLHLHKETETSCKKTVHFSGLKRVRKKHLRIATIPEPPLITFNESRGTGNDRFKGFCKDLLERLSKELDFTYELYVVPGENPSYGSCESENDGNPCVWNGLIGEIVNKEADAAIGSITITSEREGIVDFSKPFMDFTMTLIMAKSTEKGYDIFAFLRPFEPPVWISIVAILVTVTLVLFYVDKLSPYGCCHLSKHKESEFGGEEFSFPNCMWFTTASLLQQGPDYTPRSAASRILSATFWFFTLIIISTYTANLAAFFTTSQNGIAIKSLEDLAKQDKLEYGILGRGQTYSLFKHSTIPLYKQMYQFMKSRNGFAMSSLRGVERARKGGYAYLSEDPILYYQHQRRPCNTAVLRNLLEAKSYGIVLQKQSEWTNAISVVILDLRERGFIEELRSRWWDEASECPVGDENAQGTPVSLKITSLGGIYIIMFTGIVTSVIFLAVEIRYKNFLGGRCLPRNHVFNKTSRSIKHEIRFMDPCEPDDRTIEKINQQVNGSLQYINGDLKRQYSPKKSPPNHYQCNTKRDYRDMQESTL